jgi:hypothetical protein
MNLSEQSPLQEEMDVLCYFQWDPGDIWGSLLFIGCTNYARAPSPPPGGSDLTKSTVKRLLRQLLSGCTACPTVRSRG